MNERKAQGISDEVGATASPIDIDIPMAEYGNGVRTELVGVDLTKNPPEWAQFASVIDEFLTSHLFGDIFARDVLTYQQRELATIGVLVALDGVESQLGSHLFMSLKVSITPEQLYEFVALVDDNFGSQKANMAKAILDQILSTN
ncbi:MAG: carboxymuconolactone decarboxylase family protein [Alphaproteobacteria bacterium]